MRLEDYRQASLETWNAMAAGWSERGDAMFEWGRTVSERMLTAIRPQPGQTLLELAAGSGETGFMAARLLKPGGRVISSDFAPAMVEAARRRAAALGIDNMEFRVIDAERIDLETASVDGVLCRWGYMLMADPLAALRESRRVLRPGGRLAFSVWAEPERNPWGSIVAQTLAEANHMPQPRPGTPGIFALADRERLSALVTAAGFDEHEIEDVEAAVRFFDFDDYWDFLLGAAGGISIVLSQLSADEQAAVRAELAERCASFVGADGVGFPGACLHVAAA